jgi:hypothetical protein
VALLLDDVQSTLRVLSALRLLHIVRLCTRRAPPGHGQLLQAQQRNGSATRLTDSIAVVSDASQGVFDIVQRNRRRYCQVDRHGYVCFVELVERLRMKLRVELPELFDPEASSLFQI